MTYFGIDSPQAFQKAARKTAKIMINMIWIVQNVNEKVFCLTDCSIQIREETKFTFGPVFCRKVRLDAAKF